jgi:Tfp pilus assembly protein PilO
VSLWRRIYAERRRVLVPLGLLLAANLAVVVFGVLPLARSVSGLEDEAENSRVALLTARARDKQAKDAGASKTRADVELKKFYGEILPANASAARRLISTLERSANENGLTFQRTQLEDAAIKDSKLERMSGKVTLVGDYANIRKFLYAIETAPEFVIVDRVALEQATDAKSASGGRLVVTLDVATYYLAASAGLP